MLKQNASIFRKWSSVCVLAHITNIQAKVENVCSTQSCHHFLSDSANTSWCFLFDCLVQFQTAIVRNKLKFCQRSAARWHPWSTGVYLCLFDFDSNHLLPLLDDLYQLVTFFHKFCLMHSCIHLPRKAKVLERDYCFGLLLDLKGSYR